MAETFQPGDLVKLKSSVNFSTHPAMTIGKVIGEDVVCYWFDVTSASIKTIELPTIALRKMGGNSKVE